LAKVVANAPVVASESYKPQTWGGPIATLRAYQHWHPDAAIYMVEYRGRTVWMTSKQRAIWSEAKKYWKRGKRDTLQRIATVVGCSKATVSRFLRRLDLWRFIDLATLRGRGGGTYILTRTDPYNEQPRRWTASARERIRNLMATIIRRDHAAQLEPMLAQYRVQRLLRQRWWNTTGEQLPLPGKGGSTGATFMRH
jgi:hypothetical protein